MSYKTKTRIRFRNTENILEALKKRRLLHVDDLFMMKNVHINAKDLLRIDDHEGDHQCSSEVRTFALSLYYYSPKAYDFVSSNYDTCLPPVDTLRTWYVHKGGVPGFTEESLKAIEAKVKRSKKKIYCTLVLKDIPDFVSSHEYVFGEGKFGLQDVGCENDSDCRNCANTALVFTAAAINGSWAIPIGYFLLYSDSNTNKATLVTIAIFLLEKIGVEVSVLSFDWHSSYKSLVNELGCNFAIKGQNCDKLNTTFISENKKVICVLPDITNFVEFIRDTWETCREFQDGSGACINWEYIEILEACYATYTELSLSKKKSHSQLSDYPLSRNVATILRHNKDYIKSPIFSGAEGTIKFITYINDLLDIFNSRPNGIDLKKAVNETNKSVIMAKLDAIYEYFKSIKAPISFMGFCCAIKSAKEIIRRYLDDSQFEYIALCKMTTQPTETLFRNIKHYSGSQYYITARRLKIGYSKVLKHTKVEYQQDNGCVSIEYVNLLHHTCSIQKINLTSLLQHTTEKTEDMVDHSKVVNNILNIDRTEFTEEVMEYNAASVAEHIIGKLNCSLCCNALIKDTPVNPPEDMSKATQISIGTRAVVIETPLKRNIKPIGKIINPSTDVINICRCTESLYKSMLARNGGQIKDTTSCKALLVYKTLEYFIGKSIFEELRNHQFDTDPTTNHLVELMKAVAQKYADSRVPEPCITNKNRLLFVS